MSNMQRHSNKCTQYVETDNFPPLQPTMRLLPVFLHFLRIHRRDALQCVSYNDGLIGVCTKKTNNYPSLQYVDFQAFTPPPPQLAENQYVTTFFSDNYMGDKMLELYM